MFQVGEKIDSKAGVSHLEDLCLFKEGALLGPRGQWQWTNGKLKANGVVPWNVQCMPPDNQHFIHNKVQLHAYICTTTAA